MSKFIRPFLRVSLPLAHWILKRTLEIVIAYTTGRWEIRISSVLMHNLSRTMPVFMKCWNLHRNISSIQSVCLRLRFFNIFVKDAKKFLLARMSKHFFHCSRTFNLTCQMFFFSAKIYIKVFLFLSLKCTQREILGFTDQSFFVKIVFTKMLKFSWQSW